MTGGDIFQYYSTSIGLKHNLKMCMHYKKSNASLLNNAEDNHILTLI